MSKTGHVCRNSTGSVLYVRCRSSVSLNRPTFDIPTVIITYVCQILFTYEATERLFHLAAFKGKRDLEPRYWITKLLSAACEND